MTATTATRAVGSIASKARGSAMTINKAQSPVPSIGMRQALHRISDASVSAAAPGRATQAAIARALPARGEGESSEEVRSDEIARAHHERRGARSHWPGEQPLRVIWEQIEDHAGGQKHRYQNCRGYSGRAQHTVITRRR